MLISKELFLDPPLGLTSRSYLLNRQSHYPLQAFISSINPIKALQEAQKTLEQLVETILRIETSTLISGFRNTHNAFNNFKRTLLGVGAVL